MLPEEQFITAILTQAVEDAAYVGKSKFQLKHKIDAIEWILNTESEHHWSFLDYCTMLGLSPSKIQNKVRVHLNPKLTTKQQSIMKGI
jgi:AraC-like DNA-binding protein